MFETFKNIFLGYEIWFVYENLVILKKNIRFLIDLYLMFVKKNKKKKVIKNK